jgi:D-hydroxyproline dehydrogenase subunit gamma
VDGQSVPAYAGESVAAALLAAGTVVFHRSKGGRPRGPFCNMGTCFECLVRIGRAGEPPAASWVRACLTVVEDGMSIATNVEFANRDLREEGGVRQGPEVASVDRVARSASVSEDGELSNNLPQQREHE